MKKRLTVICPESEIDNGNNLAGCLGTEIGDMQSFIIAWQDADNNKYAITSGLVSEEVIDAAGKPLDRPKWDVDHAIDMDKASAAQALIKWDLSDVKGSLTSSVSDDYFGFIKSAGVFKIPVADSE